MILIKLENLVIGKFNIDGKKVTIYGKPMLCTTAPLSPRSHIKHINKARKANRIRLTGKKNDPVLTQGSQYIGEE